MEDGIGVNSPEFLQKKIERLKTALDEANVLMDRQVTERDNARAQLDGVRQENQDLKRQLEELQSQGTRVAAVTDAPAEPAAVDPGIEQSLRDRIAQLETERAGVQAGNPELEQSLRERIAQLETERAGVQAGNPALEQSLRDRIAQLESERANAQADQPEPDAGLRDRVDGLQRELDDARRDLDGARAAADAARSDAEAARTAAEAARRDADTARQESTAIAATARRATREPELPAPGPFVSQEVIREALDNDNFVLFCQPVFSLQAERITQYELLLRLRDADGRLVRPFGFLEPADRFGLMAEIDRWVVSHALDILAADSTGDLRLDVNIAAQSLGDYELTSLIEQQIAMTDLDPGRLILEVSENVAAAHLEDAQRLAKRLRGLGCGFALDDFGSTFASFRHLRDLPINYLKIDGDLVVTVTESRTGQLTIKSLVELAKGLGAETIAEYVSDDQTLEFLREQGVGYAQGYRIGRPRPIEEVLETPPAAREAPKRVQHPALGSGEEEAVEAEHVDVDG